MLEDTKEIQDVRVRLGAARAPDSDYTRGWTATQSQRSQRAYLDFITACGVVDKPGYIPETYAEWKAAGPILAFPLVRPPDDNSTMMEVRTKFHSVNGGITLLYIAARQTIFLDYSGGTVATVREGDGV